MTIQGINREVEREIENLKTYIKGFVNANIDMSEEGINTRRDAFQATIDNCKEISKTKDGRTATCSASIPMNLLAIDYRYQRVNNTAKLRKNWDVCKLMPIVVIPHYEQCIFIVVDGGGRCSVAADLGIDKLPAWIITLVPNDPEERLVFEAKFFMEQGRDDNKLRKVDQHYSMVICGDPAACAIEKACNKYDVYVADKSKNHGRKTLGSYKDAYKVADESGFGALDFIFSIIENVGWSTKNNGYSACVIRSLGNVYALHPHHRNEIHEFLSNSLKIYEPEDFMTKAKAKYLMRDYRNACILYVEDMVCNKMKLERKVYIENGRMKKGA